MKNYSHPVIGQVDLIVEDLERILPFYIDVLGLQVLNKRIRTHL